MTKTIKLAVGSIVVGGIVLGLKFVAYWITGSIALYSDALESTVSVTTAIAALLAVRLSARPADANQPYGHHKAEYFSAVLEGVLIVVAAVLILREAYQGLLHPRTLDAPLQGPLVNGLASVVNGVWCRVPITQGRRHRSPALVADGRHLLSDVISSEAEGALEAHDLPTRHAGRATFIDFHLVVPAMMTVSDAHDICDRIEQVLKQEIEGALITIHVEPENKAKHSGIVVL
jgi:divalent metal cation (Fe/Co/Zn/Cd) transporter